MVHVRCPEDLRPDFTGELELFDAEDQRTIRLRVSRDLIEAYAKEIHAHVESCRDACRRAGGRFVDVPVEMPPELALRRAFSGKGGGEEMRR